MGLTTLPNYGLKGRQARLELSELLKADLHPERNFGSYVTSSIDENAELLMLENYGKNLACMHEYPALKEIQADCVSMIANLWHAAVDETPVGAATSGSSEAILLGMLALKKRWQSRQGSEVATRRPNIVVGKHYHVSIAMSAMVCDLELRTIDVDKHNGFAIDPAQVSESLDELTVGVVMILGNTYTGALDPIYKVSLLLDEYEDKTGNNVPIHVDAASGGFFVPFLEERIMWDFTLERVVSINASSHKFGMVPAALGWVIWRDQAYISKDMRHQSSYLMGENEHITAKYSSPSTGIILQYYNFVRLGRQGLEAVMQGAQMNANMFAKWLHLSGLLYCVDSYYEENPQDSPKSAIMDRSSHLPVVTFRVADKVGKANSVIHEQYISEELGKRGYSVPCTTLPDRDQEHALRVVVRPSMTEELLMELYTEIVSIFNTHAAFGTF
ncbi:unnamed protein product [Clonostachys rosea]|uniref:Glutamate decarboxylase n=1 Tax=Bionectria ochroleuca TaxID=29856 RepID=A0ABY6UCQ8_BIOOC|nr:unnamed protein product [Clonostachys rosea]